MSSHNSQKSPEANKTNPNLKSSIVHKPFATGTVNIFNPHRRRTDTRSTSKLSLNASLSETAAEATTQTFPADIEARENWVDNLLNPWGTIAIATIFLANLISGAVIWRSYQLTSEPERNEPIPSGSANLAAEEFLPIDLGTLSLLDTTEDTVTTPTIAPIPPALAPLNNTVTALDPEYYYVLVEYSGDRSLALVRQQVKGVSLVNFPEGTFIYLGAFQERERANEFIAQLQRANLTALIYPFE